MVATTGEFITELTSRHRVLVIGGLAVIAHGFNRPTMDAGVWLEPMESANAWANAIGEICSKIPGLTIHTLPGWLPIAGDQVSIAAEEIGMVRVSGLDFPVDLFRQPNEFPPDAFDEVYARATPNVDGTRLPDPLDLIIIKLNTGRTKDLDDSRFLESVIREQYRVILPSASLAEVTRLFERFVDCDVCSMALENPSPEVCEYAMACLHELAADGDPFSQALLENRAMSKNREIP